VADLALTGVGLRPRQPRLAATVVPQRAVALPRWIRARVEASGADLVGQLTTSAAAEPSELVGERALPHHRELAPRD
jgi:hypothetical protein